MIIRYKISNPRLLMGILAHIFSNTHIIVAEKVSLIPSLPGYRKQITSISFKFAYILHIQYTFIFIMLELIIQINTSI